MEIRDAIAALARLHEDGWDTMVVDGAEHWDLMSLDLVAEDDGRLYTVNHQGICSLTRDGYVGDVVYALP